MPAAPPQNQMVIPQLRTQNGSTSLGEKSDEQETRAMLASGQCRCCSVDYPPYRIFPRRNRPGLMFLPELQQGGKNMLV